MKVEGSGRQKGTPNKATKTLEDKAESLGIDPFEMLLLFAEGNCEKLKCNDISADLRFKALKEVCSYLYPKRKSIELVNTQENKVESYEEFISRVGNF